MKSQHCQLSTRFHYTPKNMVETMEDKSQSNKNVLRFFSTGVGSSPTPPIIYYTSPAGPDLIMDTETENGKNPITTVPHLKELTDENVLINQLVLRKASNFKKRLLKLPQSCAE
ncbi:hypothetical protein CEXT_695811 [Caerostris extrusa]|uniref:Uncharacterized protein n=1 Tax=Caerostris extrusa TaxID=172846 RepID=A0AAV4ULQ3_CAEEX|nr:hypothetical protein CEXT_695811 [Caerostris extrusa]